MPTDKISGVTGASKPSYDITAFDSMSALQATFNDLSTFCDRNSEACHTGKTALLEAKYQIQVAMGKFMNSTAAQSTAGTDPMMTGSVD